MDAADPERVYEAFQDFQAYFAPIFGRKESREHSRHYLPGLLVQSQERRNAENLAETVPASARALPRFLTASPWDDEGVIGRLREYLGSRLEDPPAVWVLDGSDFPKPGVKSVGVIRQYCGALGKIASCQAGLLLAHVGPRGRALVDQRLYLPQEWTSDVERCAAAGVPEARREYRSKTELALEMLERAQARGYLKAQWVAGDSAFGMSPTLREGISAAGMQYVLDVRPDLTVRPLEPTWTNPPDQGNGRPRKPRLRREERQTMAGAERGVASSSLAGDNHRDGPPGAAHLPLQRPAGAGNAAAQTLAKSSGQSTARTWTAANPANYRSNAPEDTPLETLAHVGDSRWRIATEFETEQSDVGLDEYETRTPYSNTGQALGRVAPSRGQDAPDHAASGVPSGA